MIICKVIQRKKKICKECGEDKYIFSKGRCEWCAKLTYKKPAKQSQKNKEKKAERRDKLDKYFEYHIARCKYSEQSGTKIYSPNRSNICHILDKGRHKSVEDHLENYVYLTLEEHTTFDNHLFKNEFEKLEEKFPFAWKTVCKRLRIILPLVKERTKLVEKLEKYLEL